MKALCAKPGIPVLIHLREVPKPTVEMIADGRGVLVRVLEVGLDGADKEVIEAVYGSDDSAPGLL